MNSDWEGIRKKSVLI